VLLDAALLSTGFDDIPATARDLERRGYSALWASEVAHDPFLQLLSAGQATEHIQVGTAIAVAFARSPMTLATTAYDLQRYTRGRFVLGLGTQIKAHVERRFSMPWTAPAARMREFIGALHAIWDAWQLSAPLRFQGEHYRHTLMTPMFSPEPHEWGRTPGLPRRRRTADDAACRRGRRRPAGARVHDRALPARAHPPGTAGGPVRGGP
jgi:alkanesulfonate monooxygenase SsuD/methylene tetrahydromethanopterin reductase-like flavin-dependent oxidoreductase (luciferase family)